MASHMGTFTVVGCIHCLGKYLSAMRVGLSRDWFLTRGPCIVILYHLYIHWALMLNLIINVEGYRAKL